MATPKTQPLSPLAESHGSATFVITREVGPYNFKGWNDYGYTIWTSCESDGLRVPADKLAEVIERIQATPHSGASKLSAHLLLTTKLSDRRRTTPDEN